MLCYVYNYSINLYSLNYWLWRLSCAQGEIAELSSVYICKLLCNLIRGLGIFKLHCSTSAFIAVEPKVLVFSPVEESCSSFRAADPQQRGTVTVCVLRHNFSVARHEFKLYLYYFLVLFMLGKEKISCCFC